MSEAAIVLNRQDETNLLAGDLAAICPGRVRQGASLAALSQWRIGGPARLLVEPASAEELAALRRFLHRRGLPHVVIGATSNLLFADEGLDVVCIQIGGLIAQLEIDGQAMSVGAGVWVPYVARRAMSAGLTGAEHMSGIPGAMGGLIAMNGGSQRKGVGDSIVSVTAVDARGETVTRSRAECGFAYRRSVFQENDEVVVASRHLFEPAQDRGAVRREMLRILADRRRKFPRKTPNCGSVFASDPSTYADHGPPGAVIEGLGLKGVREGGAMISPLHANFIVNTGGATARDVLALVDRIRTRALTEKGVGLKAEVRYVGRDGSVTGVDAAAQRLVGARA